jgi:hypothetical protein
MSRNLEEAAMKTFILISIGLLTASTASAQIQTRWDDCFTDGGAANKSSACNTDIGTNRIAVSYTMPQTFTGFVAVDGQIDLRADDNTMPVWWDLKNSGACRQTAASISIDGTVLPNYSGSCVDTWDFGATGTGLFTGYARGYGGDPARARAVFAIARPASNPTTLNNGTNYLAWIWQIDNANTSTCTGCLENVSIIVTQIVLSSINPIGNAALSQTIVLTPDYNNNPYDACVLWQSAASCFGTPARATTWGNVKAMYR